MKALIQRVASASVCVEGKEIATIDTGILVLLGVLKGDTERNASWLAHKIVHHRVFPDDRASMNRSVLDINGELLTIPQFTLAANTKRGNRPDFSQAEHHSRAEELYRCFLAEVKLLHPSVKSGIFGANMQVALINDGPVTILFSSS